MYAGMALALVYVALGAALLLLLYRLVLLPYLHYSVLAQQVSSLGFIPFVGHSLHLLYLFYLNRPLSLGLTQYRLHGRHTFLYSFVVHPTIHTLHPAYIHSVLRPLYAAYDKGPISRATMEPIVGCANAIVGEEPSHARYRRLTLPAFQHPTLHSMLPLIIDLTSQHIAALSARLSPSTPSLVDVKAEFTALTFAVLTSCAFGTSLSSLPHSTATLHRTFHDLLDALYTRNLLYLPHIPVLRSLPILYLPTLQRGRAEVESLVRSIIAQRRAGLSSSLCQGPDLLDLLLQARDEAGHGFTEEEVRDQALSFIFAGHETMAGFSSWLFYELAQRPSLYRRLREEVEDVTGGGPLLPSHLSSLPLVEAAIQETLRLYPVAPLMFRRAVVDHELVAPGLPTVRVPKGTFVVLDVAGMQRMGWSRPDEFLVERWLKGKNGKAGKAGLDGEELVAGSFLPFSTGARSCMGNAFAMAEAKVITALFVRAFDMDREGMGEVEQQLKVSYTPRDVWAHLTPLKQPA